MRARSLNGPQFDELAGRAGKDLASIFIPTHRRGREVEQDRIRLKNQLSEVDEDLATLGWKPRQRDERLDAARELLDDNEFWEHQAAALALYIDDHGEVTLVLLGKHTDSFHVVMPVFMVRPILSGLSSIRARVLALTRGFVALYDVSEDAVERVEADLPGSFDDVNWFVDREYQRQQHPDRTGTSRNRHGHDPSSRSSEDLDRFLREVAHALPGNPYDTPLVVFGDDDVVARFRETASLDTISPPRSGLSSPVDGSEIRERMGPVLDDLDVKRSQAARERARTGLGLDRATSDLAEALADAMSGRLREVIVDRHAAPIWGRVDESSLEVVISGTRSPADVDLLDRLVVISMNHGGVATSLESPVDSHPFVAIRRF
jgi:hypothetical protein